MSFVYLVASGRDIIKVGKAENVRKRIRGLQTGSAFQIQVFHTIEVSSRYVSDLEKLIHKRLKRYHLRGEWFKVERHTAISIAQRAANQFAKDRSFAEIDENGESATSVRCLNCNHSGRMNLAPRPRIRFRCSRCNSHHVAVDC